MFKFIPFVAVMLFVIQAQAMEVGERIVHNFWCTNASTIIALAKIDKSEMSHEEKSNSFRAAMQARACVQAPIRIPFILKEKLEEYVDGNGNLVEVWKVEDVNNINVYTLVVEARRQGKEA